MALDDIYMLVHKQSLNNNKFENVYFYQRSDDSVDAHDLSDAFVDTIIPLIQPLQPNDTHHDEVSVTNLGNTGDNWDETLSLLGTYGVANSMPLQNAINYTFKTADRAVRPGSKRISPVPSEVATDDFVTSSGYVTAMNDLREGFDTPLTSGGFVFDPIVVKRVKVAVPDTEPPAFTYRLPEIGETPIVSLLRAVLVNTRVSSQVSRKVWRAMGASNYITLGDLMDNLVFQCGVQSDLSELAGIIHDYRVGNPGISDLLVTEAAGNAILKSLTGCVVATGTFLSCYPLGSETQILFDSSGDLVT